ncbi:hypothetical protein ABGV42_01365 [Paenibacillus pabuli]|uniref:hypothetical protein n=1 Tax=Paenibacillus pabuli TaxID=1472 RepID=UPI0032428763
MKNKVKPVQYEISDEQIEDARDKMNKGSEYFIDLVTSNFKSYPFKHFFSGHNLALVNDDPEIVAGSGTGLKPIWVHVSKYFSIMKYGKIVTGLNIDLKGKLTSKDFEAHNIDVLGEYISYNYGGTLIYPEISIKYVDGLDNLLNGKYDSSLIGILGLSLERYTAELEQAGISFN